jgi:hypothetical protein
MKKHHNKFSTVETISIQQNQPTIAAWAKPAWHSKKMTAGINKVRMILAKR